MTDYTGACCIVTRARVAIIVDAADLAIVGNRWHRATCNSTRAGKYIYACRVKDGKRLLLHRVVTACPDGFVVDHINGDRLDNRRSNLRICSHGENMRNRARHVTNRSGFKGVIRLPSGRFCAQIKADKVIGLGTFDTAEQAHAAYCKAAVELHGEFARFA